MGTDRINRARYSENFWQPEIKEYVTVLNYMALKRLTKMKQSLYNLIRMTPATNIRTFFRSISYTSQTGQLLSYLISLKNLFSKTRIGSTYGGWVIPDSFLTSGDICYCVGCGEDITFDIGLIEKYDCDVFGVDPTPRSIQYVKQLTADQLNYVLHEFALWSEEGTMKFFKPKNSEFVSHSLTVQNDSAEYINVNTIRFNELLKKNGHNEIALLKLDIEGAESTVLQTIIEDKLRIGILCVEFDQLHKASDQDKKIVASTINHIMEAGYSLYWVEALNFTFVRK